MDQIMQVSIRAVGSTLELILADFADQLNKLIDGRPETIVDINGVGQITRNPSGRSFECTRTYTITLGTNYPPVAEFAATPTGLSVQFDGNYSRDIDGAIVKYAWLFGDGGTDSLLQPVHVYSTAGTYTVSLTVTDNDGAAHTVTHDVTVAPANVPPTAEFAPNATGLSVQFDGNYSQDTDGTLVSYSWDFGDAGVSSEMQPVHLYEAAGTYTVVLTVTDNRGATATTPHDITVTA